MTSEYIKTYYITDTIYNPITEVKANRIDKSAILIIDNFRNTEVIYDKPHWHETKAEAITYLFDLRDEKIKELKDQIFKLDLEVKLLVNLKLGDVNNE